MRLVARGHQGSYVVPIRRRDQKFDFTARPDGAAKFGAPAELTKIWRVFDLQPNRYLWYLCQKSTRLVSVSHCAHAQRQGRAGAGRLSKELEDTVDSLRS